MGPSSKPFKHIDALSLGLRLLPKRQYLDPNIKQPRRAPKSEECPNIVL